VHGFYAPFRALSLWIVLKDGLRALSVCDIFAECFSGLSWRNVFWIFLRYFSLKLPSKRRGLLSECEKTLRRGSS
jgi:hypothetical protein